MNRMALQHARYMNLKKELEADIEVNAVIHAGDYAPPHKSPGFLPYDAIAVFDAGEWDEDEVTDYFEDKGLIKGEDYHSLTGVTDNSRTQEEGVAAAFIAVTDPSFE